VSSDEADWALEQVGGSILTSGNCPDLADPAPHQAVLSSPDLANSSAIKSVPTRNASDCEANGASLALQELQSSALAPSEISNQLDNFAAGFLPALNERCLVECMPDATLTGSVIDHTTAEFKEPIEIVDHALEPSIASSPAHAQPLAAGSMEPQTRMEVPEMLSRFLKVDRLNDSLRYEAAIAISEGRVQQGEDMVRRRILEEDWKWTMDSLSSTTSLNTLWE